MSWVNIWNYLDLASLIVQIACILIRRIIVNGGFVQINLLLKPSSLNKKLFWKFIYFINLNECTNTHTQNQTIQLHFNIFSFVYSFLVQTSNILISPRSLTNLNSSSSLNKIMFWIPIKPKMPAPEFYFVRRKRLKGTYEVISTDKKNGKRWTRIFHACYTCIVEQWYSYCAIDTIHGHVVSSSIIVWTSLLDHPYRQNKIFNL